MTARRFVVAVAAAAIAVTAVAFLPNTSGIAIVAGNLAALAALMYQPARKDGQ